jgi:hypothetical protein
LIQFTETLADAYVHPARNVALPSLPGRQVKFLQGHAAIKDGRDLAAMLRRKDVKVVITSFAMSWIEQILKATGEVRAEVRWPASSDERSRDLDQTRGETRPVGQPPAAAEQTTTRRPNPVWDPSWPRDPKTGRLLPRNKASGTDSADPAA